MTERYLHYLWQNKLLPFHQMTLISGEQFSVVYVGDYNETESGPDFFNAQINIDGILWSGNVELHIRSSDWYRHGHQSDAAYDNVILHVVYQHDKEVAQNGRQLPVLELRSVISREHYSNYLNFFKRRNPILCASQIAQLDRIHLIGMQDRALFMRFSRKTEFLNEFSGEPSEALYLLLARAMGSKVNQLPFEELARRVPFKMIRKIREKNRQKILLRVGGFEIPETPTELLQSSEAFLRQQETGGYVNFHSWKYGGVRPGAAPDLRIRQFAALIEKIDPELFLAIAQREDLRSFLHSHFTFGKGTFEIHHHLKRLSSEFIDQIIINAIVPFLWWFGQLKCDEQLVELAIDLLSRIPAERNSIISKWKNVGVPVENAYESQAMLEIFNEFCSRKKCLSCGIGKTLLDR
jgi:hypothetical protein